MKEYGRHFVAVVVVVVVVAVGGGSGAGGGVSKAPVGRFAQ